MTNTRFGIYGLNGHQIQHELQALEGAASLEAAAVYSDLREMPDGVRRVDSLEALLEDSSIDAISLCSPRRDEQAEHAVRCLEAGRHVYAEKPCALTDKALDRIIDAAIANDRHFHEMGSGLREQPYQAIAMAARRGEVGEVVQIVVQKSYPWADQWRPEDEGIDGGLVTQVGIYPFRHFWHVSGARLTDLSVLETRLGNPRVGGNCRMALSFQAAFEGGILGTATCNYLNQNTDESDWAYEYVRVFGSDGIIESVPYSKKYRIRKGGRVEEFEANGEESELVLFLSEIASGSPIRDTLEMRLYPTRLAIEAQRRRSAV